MSASAEVTGAATPAFVGVDLAWGTRNRTGLAAVDGHGRLLGAVAARSDEQILDVLRPWTTGPCLVAVDAPLIVTNATGQRPCEAQLNAVFRRYDAGTHPANTGRSEFANGSRGLRLAQQLGLDVAPFSTADRRAIEVYPHPATIALFGLDRILRYKPRPGRDLPALRGELLRLLGLLESLRDATPPLCLDGPEWRHVRQAVQDATRKSALKAVEDVVDAVLCAYVGLFVTRHPDRATVFGDGASGYIVTPSLAPPA